LKIYLTLKILILYVLVKYKWSLLGVGYSSLTTLYNIKILKLYVFIGFITNLF